MTKKQIFYFGLFGSIVLLSSGFRPFKIEMYPWLHTFENKELYTVPMEVEVEQRFFDVPFTGKTFVGFTQDIGVRESRGIYNIVNSLGYLGKYQFGKETLAALGIEDQAQFLSSKKLQEKAFLANLARNKWELRQEIANYSGQEIRGIVITESGILAAAHLGGVGSVKRFLRTNGNRKCRDGYGTSVAEYLKEFGGYDTSCVEANKKAKAHHYTF
ncbi:MULTISPECIES: peptidoglycan-binding protein LysM [Flavobacterium]|uniref:Peptidoglycan-binding protein LysM n=1 Tax=Flavobacterium columnare TaxID=996 RepID=A0AA94JPB7_9FLAO|nr:MULTISPECIES: peptidoglycan-binding protein LysM [Flavobacterium]OXA78475.1 peptidoglycan-binding protein LysM [Flavobacterium columnare NBRC 100251 = ATCC 23463]MCH4828877.1 peptidoglycan-binding protein LysM [Flavobacterium columnare]MCH4832131.1 peptidoglycan-binding protein LysM [Flavobacterium columnare]MCJ1806028.1 peptidoglycan-binding protein LysM [Flavobacterium covae]OWP86300.1 peptidoglycan-binding protein LysM [Flavobacterium covae]